MRPVLFSSLAVTASSYFLLKGYSGQRGYASMAAPSLSQDELKKLVGYKAVDDYVKSNMVVGLGTGSTAYFAG